jgi:flagellar motility protein MotE (MotC chaperone)
MKVYVSKEDLEKQKEYLQSQCRKAGLTIATQREELLSLKKILNLKDKEIRDLKEVNEEHRKLNGKLRKEVEELEKLNKLMYEHP